MQSPHIMLYALMAALVFWTSPANAEQKRLLLLGDSLVAGYGLEQRNGFALQLSDALSAQGLDVDVINGGVSGDTSAGGKARLGWSLTPKPDAVLVELGANDGLRGLDPAATKQNLDAILRALKDQNIPVLLAGMLAPPNLGPEYGQEFNALFPALAKTHNVALYPFFLEGVAAVPSLNQDDGIHPNAQGVAEIVKRILPDVIDLLKQAGA